jgi:nucleotide-binding universal stress UspA family protein
MSGAKRRSFEAGHRPKFLVVIDETPECDRALRFAARRCTRTGANLTILGIVDPPDNFEFLGVGDALRAEAEAEAADLIAAAAEKAREAAGIEPERAIRVGERAEAIRALIDEDPDISFLVLAAASGKEGPGPLVSMLSGSLSGTFPVPVVIVPGHLEDSEIDALAG